MRLTKAVLLALFAVLVVSPSIANGASAGRNGFFAVDLNTGQLTHIGCVGTNGKVTGLAVLNGSTAYAATDRNRLITFTISNPAAPTADIAVSGLARGERLAGIDLRPATGELYALGSKSTIYVINPATGVATPVGASFTPKLEGAAIGFDFNPTVDRIRIVTDRQQNLRLLPTTGQVASVDGSIKFKDGDVNERARPRTSGAGYTNSDTDPITGTTLYVIDANRDVLAIQNPPNDGILSTVGEAGYNLQTVGGFDILAPSTGYAVARAGGVC